MLSEIIQNKIYYKIFDRKYKHSTGVYTKYNHSSDDKKLQEISQNIRNIKSEHQADKILLLKQVHGTHIIDMDINDVYDYPEGDAAITTKKNIILSILSADCVPVLFASDSYDGLIGVAHCGWKTALKGIIPRVIKAIKDKGYFNIKAIIGPSIHQDSYEVDIPFYQNFVRQDSHSTDFFIKFKDKYKFDIPSYVKRQIKSAGVEIFHHIEDDTYKMPNLYPSYRRSCHNGEDNSARILSTIIIKS